MRPIASLSPSLLARKGQARPAMRPQLLSDPQAGVVSTDDLGWNDMGPPGPITSPDHAETDPAELPPVLVERAALTQEVVRIAPTTIDLAEPLSGILARADTAGVRKAAFTLRLPADRHLRLRLASAVTRRSAQALVSASLDAFLSTLPEVEELARRCSPTDDLGNRP